MSEQPQSPENNDEVIEKIVSEIARLKRIKEGKMMNFTRTDDLQNEVFALTEQIQELEEKLRQEQDLNDDN